MSLIRYDQFYFRYGIRRPSQLQRPPMPKLDKLALPLESIYHYPGVSPLDDGPPPDSPVFMGNIKPIYVQSITDLGRIDLIKGNPRRLVMDVERAARHYRQQHPRFRLARELEISTRDPGTVFVYNYAYIHRLYKYMRNYFTAYFKWWNLTSSLWNRVALTAEQSNRQQFIEISLPKTLPSVSTLRQAQTVMSQTNLKRLNSPESWMLLELWKWFGEHRDRSLLGQLKPEHYRKVNLVFRESDRWFVLNLDQVDQWRLSTKEEAEHLETPRTKGLSPEQLQRRFLRLMISLFEARTNPEITDNLEHVVDVSPVVDAAMLSNAGNKPNPNPAPVKTEEILKGTETTGGPGSTIPAVAQTPKVDDKGQAEERSQIVDDEETAPEEIDTGDLSHAHLTEDNFNDEELDQQIDADLEKLEEIDTQTAPDIDDTNVHSQHVDHISTVNVHVKSVETLESAIVNHCNRLADAGGLSAAEYRKYIDMAGTYKTIQMDNGETLDKFIQVTPKMTTIEKSPTLVDKTTVLDKSMLKSSLLEFDKRYTEEVLHRDVGAMVMNLQKAGIIVTGYNVEEVEDITGTHTVHEIKIKPLEGTASTLTFKLPKVDSEGTFKVNGVNYKLRKQRGAMPIVKINPYRVALTSYYGKVFVIRSQKRANDYGRWLTRNIMSLALSDDNDIVTNMIPGNVFVSGVKLPRLYTILAQDFTKFDLKIVDAGVSTVWHCEFNYRTQAVPKMASVGRAIQDGNVLVGSDGNGNWLFIGQDSNFYKLEGNKPLEGLPAIEDILGLPTSKVPLDFAELEIYSQTIPVAVVLSYLVGLKNLVKALGVRPRVVPAGERVPHVAGEWSIVFQDETWVFQRENERDDLAAMILGGWREYKETTMAYNAHEFSKRDVYLNVLNDAGLGVRYLRELDLLSQMFVDPITKELLLSMGEPTDFEGLLNRASKLLLVDQHPDELDSAQMRIKGYERFAGTVYSELVRSVRSHNARGRKNRYSVEMNPYEVWMKIQQDPSKNQVVEINPIQALKETEAVTYSGTGGRSTRSMTKRTRIYHENDVELISESTVDNSDVGVNIFLSADPQFNSLRGTARKDKAYKRGEVNPASILSTSALTSVGATVDD